MILQLKVSGQYYDIGQEPWKTRWEQIRTENFKLIYPQEFRSAAKEAAILFEQWHYPVTQSLKAIPQPTPLIFHTGNIYSNAYTVWAPKRIELLTVPPQDIYNQQWIEQLAIHEYRHVVQITKVNQGFTHFLSAVFGQQAVPAIIGLFIPSWFMEGDAVAAETGLSFTGRGRVADFAMPLRAQINDKGIYSYVKATLGSYKDFVPDSYILGYHIVATARNRYGTDVWNSAIDRTAKRPYTLNPFSRGIKLITGLNKVKLYEQSMIHLDSLWNDNQKAIPHFQIRLEGEKSFSSYLHPYPVENGIVALKTSQRNIPRFVLINNSGEEKTIHIPGAIMEDEVYFNGRVITWIERRPDIRWQNQSYSNIIVFNPLTGKATKIRTHLRVFAPAMNPENNLLVVSEVTIKGENYLTLMDTTGNIVNRIASPLNMYISSPAWSNDGKQIAYIATGLKGKEIVVADLTTGRNRILTPFTGTMISDMLFQGQNLIFNMDVNNRSEIVSFDTLSKEIRLLTISGYGTKHPYFDTKRGYLLYSFYTADGYRLAQSKNQQLSYKLTSFENNNHWPLADALGEQEISLAETHLPDDSMKIEKYPRTAGLFNFHSWAPVYIDVNDQTFRPGASVMSQNLLSTMFFTAGYDYNTEEKAGQIKADLSWRGWFPEINTTFSLGNRSSIAGHGDTAFRFTWQETSWDIAVGLPLSTISGIYNIGSYIEAKHRLLNIEHNSSTPHEYAQGTIGALNYRATFYALRKRAFRDLAPKWGVSAEGNYKHSVWGDINSGDMFSIQARLYLPGLVTNHSLQLYGGYQQRNPSAEGYRFAGDLSLPSGYRGNIPKDFIRLRPSYSLPLVYPDYSLGTLLFIKRFRANLFYDAAWMSEHGDWTNIASAGYDLILDLHVLTLPAPVSLGIRSAYLIDRNKMDFSLIFSADLATY